MDLRSFRRDFVLEFIHCFKEHDCLWKYTSRDYKNKVLKTSAYNKLLEIYQQHNSNSTLADVKKTIQSLRACHRKERKKVRSSMTTGSGADEVYKPKLWYYTELEFLNDQTEYTSSVSNLDDAASTSTDVNLTMESLSEVEMSAPSSVSSLPASSPSSCTLSQRGRKKPNEQEQKETLMEQISKKLQSTEDEFDVIGKNIAHKLRAMDTDQRIYTEKIINDALYYGTLKHLTFHSCITTGTVGTRTVIDRPVQCSTPFITTFSQSPNVNSSFVPNNNVSCSNFRTQPESVTLNAGNQLIDLLPHSCSNTQASVQNFLNNFAPE
ncbi:hypothetical protein ACJJTC_002787 [Scirpophaga incertulas]